MKHLVAVVVLLGIGSISALTISQTSTTYHYGNEKFFFGTTKRVNWFKANYLCKQRGMELVSVNSQEKQNEIENLIKERLLGNYSYWTSGTRLGNKNDYYWMTDGNPFIYTNWVRGEPSGDAGDGEIASCVELRREYHYQWNDRLCSNRLSFICEQTDSNTKTLFTNTDSHKYYFGTANKLNWYMANRQCRNLGMDLVSIETQDEQEEIEKQIKSNGLEILPFWTSGSIHAEEFYWMSNGKSINYTNWDDGEPNEFISEGEVEKCLVMYKRGLNLKWNDVICKDTFNYICEKAQNQIN